MCVCSKSLQSRPTLCKPMDCSLPGSSIYGIFQAKILEWVAMPSSRRSSWCRDGTTSPVSPALQVDSLVLSHCESSFKIQSVQSLFFETPWTAARQAPLSWSLLRFASIELVMLSNHLILCCSLQSFPALGSFPMSQLFASGGQSIRVSASASVHPMNIQGWFPSGWTGWISLQIKGLSRVFCNTKIWKHQFFDAQRYLCSNSHIHTWVLEKLWLYGPLLVKWYLYFFNTLSRFVIAFLPRSNCLLISGVQSLSTVILEPKKIESVTSSTST